jgi:hypothetical protein
VHKISSKVSRGNVFLRRAARAADSIAKSTSNVKTAIGVLRDEVHRRYEGLVFLQIIAWFHAQIMKK